MHTKSDVYRALARLHLQAGNLGKAADLQERRELICPDGNERYEVEECRPEMAQENKQ